MEHRIERLWRRGLDHYQADNLDAAQASFEGILAREPKHGPARYRLALIAGRREQHPLAIALCEQVLAAEPNRAEVLVQLARSRVALGEFAAARDAVDRASQLPRLSVPVLDALAVLETRLERPRKALDLYARALRESKPSASLHFNRALVYRALGDAAAAVKDVEACLALEPDHAKAQWVLSEMRRATPVHNAVETLRKRLASLPAAHPSEEYYAYALFKELDDLGQPPLAWPQLDRGLRARRAHQKYDLAAEKQRVSALLADPGADRPSAEATPGPVPVFVIGVPRSGVGVLSDLLARHPAIAAPSAHTHLAAAIERPLPDGRPPDPAEVRRRYLAHALPAGSDAAFLLDRQPMNFLYVPAIKRAFPEARLLHVERDPVDACFSQLRRLFPEHGMAIANVAELAEAYRDYRRMMAAWHARLPGAVLDVSYESLVEKPEMVLRVAFASLGLRFDRAVLGGGPPLRTDRVGGARAYEQWLPELRALRDTALVPAA
jgi:tetratricopeptide (TPR) repeat protein